MNLKDLKEWRNLTEEERERIKYVYNQSPEIEPTLHDNKPDSLEKAAEQKQLNETREDHV